MGRTKAPGTRAARPSVRVGRPDRVVPVVPDAAGSAPDTPEDDAADRAALVAAMERYASEDWYRFTTQGEYLAR